MDQEPRDEDESTEPLTERGRQALTGLRALWTATGQMQEEFVRLECSSDSPEGCSASIGFDGLAEAVEPTTDTADALSRLRSAWKTTLAREGKLHDPGGDPGKPTERGAED